MDCYPPWALLWIQSSRFPIIGISFQPGDEGWFGTCAPWGRRISQRPSSYITLGRLIYPVASPAKPLSSRPTQPLRRPGPWTLWTPIPSSSIPSGPAEADWGGPHRARPGGRRSPASRPGTGPSARAADTPTPPGRSTRPRPRTSPPSASFPFSGRVRPLLVPARGAEPKAVPLDPTSRRHGFPGPGLGRWALAGPGIWEPKPDPGGACLGRPGGNRNRPPAGLTETFRCYSGNSCPNLGERHRKMPSGKMAAPLLHRLCLKHRQLPAIDFIDRSAMPAA